MVYSEIQRRGPLLRRSQDNRWEAPVQDKFCVFSLLLGDSHRRIGSPPMTPLRRLLGYALRYRTKFLRGLACVVVTTAVSLLAPRVLGFAIDDLTKGVTVAKLALYGSLL